MSPTDFALLLEKQGPLALALVVSVMANVGVVTALIRFAVWVASNTVPLSVHELVCNDYAELARRER